MKPALVPPPCRKGFTLLELSVVIGVLLALMGLSMYATSALKEWRLGRDAAEKLRAAYAAQRNYLADNPTTAVTLLDYEKLRPYLPSNFDPNPTGTTPFRNDTLRGTSLTGGTLHIRVNVSPPYMTTSNTAKGDTGTRYDPSGSTTDSLWDVGK